MKIPFSYYLLETPRAFPNLVLILNVIVYLVFQILLLFILSLLLSHPYHKQCIVFLLGLFSFIELCMCVCVRAHVSM